VKITRWVPAIAAGLALIVTGCGKQGGPETASTPSGGSNAATGATNATTKKWVIGMSQCNLGEPWRVQMNKDIETAAKAHPELQIIYRDAQNKSETQQDQVREFVQQHVNLIIISPKEARPLTKPVSEAVKAGIPVIVLDRKVEGNDYTCFIGGDNHKIGLEAGKFINKLLGGKGNLVELKGLMTSTPGQERHDGFMEGIKGSQIKIVFDADCQWLEPNAQREMKSALSRFPKIDAVFGHNDPSAHGAYMAARQEGRGREKTIKFIGIDGLPNEGVRYVKDGILTATFQYPTGGQEAIDNALKILNGQTVPKNITLGTKIFTKDTVAQGGKPL
jgi:ribose transport system substrate-binding protein